MDLHLAQPEREVGSVHWHCRCSCESCIFCLCWSVLSAVSICMYVLCACVPIGNTRSALLLGGPGDKEQTPHLCQAMGFGSY